MAFHGFTAGPSLICWLNHRIQGIGIFTYIWLICMVKKILYIEPMGIYTFDRLGGFGGKCR